MKHPRFLIRPSDGEVFVNVREDRYVAEPQLPFKKPDGSHVYEHVHDFLVRVQGFIPKDCEHDWQYDGSSGYSTNRYVCSKCKETKHS